MTDVFAYDALQYPALIFPQVIICGLFVPLAALPDVLEKVAYFVKEAEENSDSSSE